MNLNLSRRLRLVFLALSFGALACDLGDVTAMLGGSKPDVAIVSPPSGSIYHEGEEVAVQSTANDAKGIVRVELIVDGAVVRSDPSPAPQPKFTIIQTWKATQGAHTISVRAYNGSNTGSDPAAISINVAPGIALNATPTSAAVPTAGAPAATLTSPPPPPTVTGTPGPGACSNDSAFVADVTVPDGTVISAGQGFNKIWRVRNSGTCAWGVGYDFAFVGGETMGTTTFIGTPNTAPGATADLLIAFTAPGAPGTHAGQWRVRAGGVPFGGTFDVVINVPPAAPPCPGPPVISSFNASPNPINAGSSTTLSWGAVTNATSATIDHGIGGIATPGNRSVSPASTTTYVLTATGCGGIATSQATVTVNPAPVGNFGGHWVHNFGTMDITQVGSSVTGTYHNSFDGGNGTIAGNVVGNTFTGTSQKAASHTTTFTLGAGGNTFDGNWDGTNQWCGARSGVAFPSGCGFSGAWINRVTGNSNCSMTLTQVDSSITGTYCNGSVSGTVSYTGSSNETILNGTWIAGGTGPFKFYLLGYTGDQFQGNYSTTFEWCGRRSSASLPSPCLR